MKNRQVPQRSCTEWPLRPQPSCPDLSGMAESSRRHVYSEQGCVTLDAVNTGVQNQYQTTLPCFQMTKMEETNDLKNGVPLEQKHYCKTLPSSIISKAQHRAWNLRLTDGKPSLKIGVCTGRTQAQQTKPQLPLARLQASSPSFSREQSQEELESRTEGGNILRSPLADYR